MPKYLHAIRKAFPQRVSVIENYYVFVDHVAMEDLIEHATSGRQAVRLIEDALRVEAWDDSPEADEIFCALHAELSSMAHDDDECEMILWACRQATRAANPRRRLHDNPAAHARKLATAAISRLRAMAPASANVRRGEAYRAMVDAVDAELN
jgi:arylsulfatase A-like enzyme